MKAVRIPTFGVAADVAELIDLAEPPPPESGEVLVQVVAAPIDPSDLARARGAYRGQDVPYIGGSEGLGVVLQVGADVNHLREGDRVMLFGVGSWRERLTLPAAGLTAMPGDADPLQIAQLSINPPTAYFMLHEFVTLQRGDWVVMNAANSAVGAYVAQIARTMGVRTVGVVRREEAVQATLDSGAEVALVDGPDLAKRVREATSGAAIRLALDAVAGDATGRLAACLAHGGTLVSYGALSARPCSLPAPLFIFSDIQVRGYLLSHTLHRSSRAEIAETYAKLARMIAAGELRTRIGPLFGLDAAREALETAERGGNDGKIMFVPNGQPG